MRTTEQMTLRQFYSRISDDADLESEFMKSLGFHDSSQKDGWNGNATAQWGVQNWEVTVECTVNSLGRIDSLSSPVLLD